jgi:membrane protein DedA with SNARE-associated domain
MKVIYGYIALFIGCFLEGETSLIAGSFAAHRGMLEIVPVFIVAYVSTQCSDWLWFITGRKQGHRILDRKPKWEKKYKRIDKVMKKYPVAILLGYRFIYGFRSILPIGIGMSSISAVKFFIFSQIGTFLWASMLCCAGYFFGAIIEANFKKIEHYEVEILIGLIVTGLTVGLLIRLITKWRMRNESVDIISTSPG